MRTLFNLLPTTAPPIAARKGDDAVMKIKAARLRLTLCMVIAIAATMSACAPAATPVAIVQTVIVPQTVVVNAPPSPTTSPTPAPTVQTAIVTQTIAVNIPPSSTTPQNPPPGPPPAITATIRPLTSTRTVTPTSTPRAYVGFYEGQAYSFRSFNIANHWIRHRDFFGELTEIQTESERADATFTIRTIPTNRGCIALAAVNFDRYYLRHSNFRIRLDQDDGSKMFRDDSTFCPQVGLANPLASPSSVTFESYNYPGYYLRHRDFHLWLEKGPDDLFRADATFLVSGALFIR